MILCLAQHLFALMLILSQAQNVQMRLEFIFQKTKWEEELWILRLSRLQTFECFLVKPFTPFYNYVYSNVTETTEKSTNSKTYPLSLALIKITYVAVVLIFFPCRLS